MNDFYNFATAVENKLALAVIERQFIVTVAMNMFFVATFPQSVRLQRFCFSYSCVHYSTPLKNFNHS